MSPFLHPPQKMGMPAAECIVCMRDVHTVTLLQPCGHTGTCLRCAMSIFLSSTPECPECHATFRCVRKGEDSS